MTAGCSLAEASAATLREMNPLVRVAARTGQPGAPPGPALLADVDVAVLTGAGPSLQLAWDAACRAAGVAFYAAACHGSAGYLFADLSKHTYAPTVRASTTVYHLLYDVCFIHPMHSFGAFVYMSLLALAFCK